MDPLNALVGLQDSSHRLRAPDGKPLAGTSVWGTSPTLGPFPGRKGYHGKDNDAFHHRLNFWMAYLSVVSCNIHNMSRVMTKPDQAVQPQKIARDLEFRL